LIDGKIIAMVDSIPDMFRRFYQENFSRIPVWVDQDLFRIVLLELYATRVQEARDNKQEYFSGGPLLHPFTANTVDMGGYGLVDDFHYYFEHPERYIASGYLNPCRILRPTTHTYLYLPEMNTLIIRNFSFLDIDVDMLDQPIIGITINDHVHRFRVNEIYDSKSKDNLLSDQDIKSDQLVVFRDCDDSDIFNYFLVTHEPAGSIQKIE
jgi:hypothetical protein